MRRKWLWPALAAVGLSVVAAASAAGGRTIADAPTIGLNRTVTGRLIDGALFSGYSGAYYKVDLTKGDRVALRMKSVGGAPPCQNLFVPGTDDSNVSFNDGFLSPTFQNHVGTRGLQRWIAPASGTYVLATNNAVLDSFDCLAADAKTTYRFVVTATHQLKLKFRQSLRSIRAGKPATVVVVGKNGESHPVTGPRLVLYANEPGKARVRLARAKLSHGSARFAFTVPARLRGKTVRLSAAGGDGLRWARTYAFRRVPVR